MKNKEDTDPDEKPVATTRKNDEDYDGWEISPSESLQETQRYHHCWNVNVTKGMGTQNAYARSTTPAGILRLGDLGKVSSGTSLASGSRGLPMELKFLSQIEPSSPQPSIDRLSVTFAEDSSARSNIYNESSFPSNSNIKAMDKVRFPDQSQEVDHSEDEDYSASVTAIMQRRASVRRSKKRNSSGTGGGRRGSSPFSPDVLPENENGRRRSSVFTTSSGDTAITMEDSFTAGVTQDQIFENIKLHKEVLGSVKMQPWNMRKKLKLVMQAKAYIKKHEGALQERLAQSHSTRDMLARCNIYLVKKLQQLKREAANLSNWLIPWELRIKEIESHFGSVVASYFIFLRWLFWVNIAISALWIAFVAVPEMLTADFQSERKSILPEDKYNATNFLTLWDFEGVFKYSPMFYGWYTNISTSTNYGIGYRLPLAYFFTGLVVYIFSFVATLRKMAENSRMSKLSEKEDECIFSWKIFTGWDYMIGNAETAHNRVASIIMGFKEALLEEAEKKREAQSWKVIGSRVLVNIGVLTLLGLSAFAVITVVARSNEKEATSTTWRRNEITVVMSLITLFFPIFFELLGYFEHYHPRKQLRLQLARIMVLNLLNLYSLIFALFGKISDMTNHLQSYKYSNDTLTTMEPEFDINFQIVTTPSNIIELNYTTCECDHSNELLELQVENLVSALLTNVTNTIPPELFANLTLSFSNMTIENVTDIYENLTGSITAFSLNYLENTTAMMTMKNEEGYYELDFTPLRNALEELFTNLFDLFENSTETALIEESINTTFASFLDSTIYNTNTNTPLSSTESLPNEFFDRSTQSDTNTAIVSTTIDSTLCHFYCKHLSNTTNPTDTTTTRTYAIRNGTSVKHFVSGKSIDTPDYQNRSRLRSLCWETMFGQELVKLTIMDLVMTLLSILAIDFFRGLFVRYMNNCWCWDLEKKFPQYGDFKVAENILHLVNNQGMVWMGMFFSPGLVVINVIKLYIMMYLRSWAVLTCNVPHEVIFRASRSNNFYYALLLMMLFLCVLPVSYAIVWLNPSWHCGPFSGYKRIFHIFTKTLRAALPRSMHKILDYIASPGIVIPLLMLLILIIYYLISLSNALRESNNDLKIQLRRERTEERRKMFRIADRRGRGGSDGSEPNTPFGKWKKLLQGLPSNKSFDDSPKQDSIETPPKQESVGSKGALSKFILRNIKTQKPGDVQQKQEQSQQDDATDTEQHDSLPDDPVTATATANIDIKVQRSDNDKPTTDNKQIKINNTNKRAGSISKDSKTRKDSINSNWSENQIPVITISKTESSECILDDKNERSNKHNQDKIKIDVEKVEDTDSGKPKIRYVLKKQPVFDKEGEIKKELVERKKCEEEITKSGKSEEGKETKKESSSSTRTEPSTDYQDNTFCN